jgi:hypothetical protein
VRSYYRHIPTKTLEESAKKLADDLVFNALHYYTTLSGPPRRELKRISRELDRRKTPAEKLLRMYAEALRK